MKTTVIITASLLAIAVLSPSAEARGGRGSYSGNGSNPRSTPHRGYLRRDGTTVQPHYQTNPNSTGKDNYGTKDNINPHNGRIGKGLVDR